MEAGAQKKENARDWDESMCHRDDKGQFGEGGGGGKEAAATSQDEKQKKIDSVKIDFSRDNILPGLNQEDLAALGKEDKPVLLKKDIVTKNLKHHPEVAKEDYDRIVGQSLYNPDGIFPGSSKEPRFNFVSRIGDDKSTLTLLEMAETKDNYEIINLHWIKDRQRKQKERGK